MTKKCRWIVILLSLVILLGIVPMTEARAEETGNMEMAQEISGAGLITDKKGYYNTAKLFDGDEKTILDGGKNAYLTLTHEEGIGSVYLIFGMEHGVRGNIYAGDGKMIHSDSKGVCYDDLYSGYYERTFVCARRIVNTASPELELTAAAAATVTRTAGIRSAN